MTWWVYIIAVDDGTLYTGVTTNVPRRFREHGQGGCGARYFAGRQPVAVVYTEALLNRGEAQRREAAIKKLKRPAKLRLLQDYLYFR